MLYDLNKNSKQKYLFSKTENRKVIQFLSEGWYQWEGRGYMGKVEEDECRLNIMYT
jgi:hypothetical protein